MKNKQDSLYQAIGSADPKFILEAETVVPVKPKKRLKAIAKVALAAAILSIAGVIAMMPKCIVFDESTAMLDPRGRAEVMQTIRRLNQDFGMTILHITHYMDEAVMADRILVVNDGEIYRDGTPKEVFADVEGLRRVGLDESAKRAALPGLIYQRPDPITKQNPAGFEKEDYHEDDCTFFVKGEVFADFVPMGLRIPSLSHA